MKYAVVVPNFNPQDMPRTLTDLRGTFPEAFNPLSDQLGGTTGTTGHVADDEGRLYNVITSISTNCHFFP